MNTWPVITEYSGRKLTHVAMPIGGIGTGTVSLGGRGNLRDWEIMNRPAKGFIPLGENHAAPFFALCLRGPDGKSSGRLLEGPLDRSAYEGGSGCQVENHGLPRFRKCSFSAAFPLAEVRLSDPQLPVAVTLQAFNPLVPADSLASGLPVAVLRYTVRNTSNAPLAATVCGTIPNFIGMDGSRTEHIWGGRQIPAGDSKNQNDWHEDDMLRGIRMSSQHEDTTAETFGTIALTTPDAGTVSHRLHWQCGARWAGDKIDFWDDLLKDGLLDDRPGADETRPVGSLALTKEIPAGAEASFTFLITWHFPNRRSWSAPKDQEPQIIGNFYCTRFTDAWDAARHAAQHLPALEQRTLAFVRAFTQTDLPPAIKEAALNNLSTLRTQTCFQTPDGNFFGFEGSHDHLGSCYGSCTHVWNYEQATAFLFGGLARSMRRIEFARATDTAGCMSFRVNLPLAQAQEFGKAAADGQMGCIMKLYRDWQLSGDDAFLRELWPHARRALEFCWIENGWDADRDGVMEGCQHNTMDVEYFGPNPQMTGWYLGALKAAQLMAAHLGEPDFAAECLRLFTSGSQWMDQHLFNGSYYIQKIVPPVGAVPESLIHHMGARDLGKPDFQLGEGCLVDQLVGQYMAHVCGLGYLHDQQKVRKTLQTICTINRRTGFYDHFNPMRSFTLGDESALLMAEYPAGLRPEFPFPYYGEVMTGFEYTVAAHLIYEQMEGLGLQCVADIRERYDGERRSPFDEAECGHHYARAMASWASVLAWTGFHYSAVTRTLRLSARRGRFFWSSGDAWGVYDLQNTAAGTLLKFGVREGAITVKDLLVGDEELRGDWPLGAGEEVVLRIGG